MAQKIHTEPQMQAKLIESHRENRRVLLFCIVAVIMAAIACNSNPLFGITTTQDFDPENVEVEVIVGDSESTTEDSEPIAPEQSGSMSESNNQSGDSQGSEAVTNNLGLNEYSVTAQDFNCICSVSGNINVELRVNGDQLEIIDPGGNVEVFDKIGENTYQKSWMGYYIDTTGGKETKVDEEKSVIIILTPTGYVMEHYKGSEGSPCCVYTFTKEN